jgi:hypothetical protein
MHSLEAAAVRTRGHNYITGSDERRFLGRRESRFAQEAMHAARKAGGWLWATPLLTVALVIGAGFVVQRVIDARAKS